MAYFRCGSGKSKITIPSMRVDGSGSRYSAQNKIYIDVDNFKKLTFDAKYQLGTGSGTARVIVYDSTSGTDSVLFTQANPTLVSKEIDITNCTRIALYVSADIAADITSNGWCQMYNIRIE